MLNNFALYQFGPILSFTTLFVEEEEEEEETPLSLTCWASPQVKRTSSAIFGCFTVYSETDTGRH